MECPAQLLARAVTIDKDWRLSWPYATKSLVKKLLVMVDTTDPGSTKHEALSPPIMTKSCGQVDINLPTAPEHPKAIPEPEKIPPELWLLSWVCIRFFCQLSWMVGGWGCLPSDRDDTDDTYPSSWLSNILLSTALPRIMPLFWHLLQIMVPSWGEWLHRGGSCNAAILHKILLQAQMTFPPRRERKTLCSWCLCHFLPNVSCVMFFMNISKDGH